jgi:hypothetical protein
MKQWYHKHPQYKRALNLAKTLMRLQLVGTQWDDTDALASWLVRPLEKANKLPLVKPTAKRRKPNAK